jgi:hypothetical protein
LWYELIEHPIENPLVGYRRCLESRSRGSPPLKRVVGLIDTIAKRTPSRALPKRSDCDPQARRLCRSRKKTLSSRLCRARVSKKPHRVVCRVVKNFHLRPKPPPHSRKHEKSTQS